MAISARKIFWRPGGGDWSRRRAGRLRLVEAERLRWAWRRWHARPPRQLRCARPRSRRPAHPGSWWKGGDFLIGTTHASVTCWRNWRVEAEWRNLRSSQPMTPLRSPLQSHWHPPGGTRAQRERDAVQRPPRNGSNGCAAGVLRVGGETAAAGGKAVWAGRGGTGLAAPCRGILSFC